MPVDERVTLIRAQLCFENDCRSDLIDLDRRDAGIPCARWESVSSVCIDDAAQPGQWQIDAFWEHRAPAEPPRNGSRYMLRITDEATGVELLNVTRAARYEHPPQPDDCHDDCFGAELTL